MRIIIKESQYQRVLLENDYQNFYDNFPIILEELLQVSEFREDLKEHSYNKNGYVNWWKRAKEDMQFLIRDKYCGLFKQLAKKYKFKLDVDGERYLCVTYGGMFVEAFFRQLRSNKYYGDDAPIDDSSYDYEGPPWVSQFFMKTFYGK